MKKFLICLLSVFMMASLAACGNSAEGESVSSASALARKLESKSDKTINISEDIVLTEPIEIVGNKSIIGSGTITVSAEGMEEAYMITLEDGAQLTISGNATIDLSSLAGGIHVKEGTTLILQDEAIVTGASVKSSNVLVEGTFNMNGGLLEKANGHNLINKNTTVIAGGEIKGSGSKYAAVYNEGALTQNDGTITGAYNNVVSASGSSFTWNKGEIKTALDDAVIIEEGASIKITSADAKMTGVFAKGLVLNGEGVIDNVTMTDSMDSMIAVGAKGKLTFNGGKISDAGLHGIDNAGNLLVTGGTIYANYDSGVCNTGTFEMTGGTIMNNTNKGVLNKAGTAKIVSASAVLSGNRFAIGNEEGAYFELAEAKLMQSTTTNVYAYGGEMYIHDIVLATSGSNNMRVVAANVRLEDMEIKGINASGSKSMHGLLLEGGTVTAKNVIIGNTTGNAIRNKGGNFQGENITIKDVKNVGISNTNQDETGREGIININKVTVENAQVNNVLIEGGTCTLTNAMLDRCKTNNIKVTDGKLIIKNSTVNGNVKDVATGNHGIYMVGGTVEATNTKITNVAGAALRINGEEAVFNGKKITFKDVGVAGINQTVGTVKIDNLTTINVGENNIKMAKGTVELTNAVLSPVANNSIRLTGDGKITLTDVEIQGHVEGTPADCHAIFPTNGTIIGNNLDIHDVAGIAVRVNGENAKVILNNVNIDGAGYMAYRIGAGDVTVTNTTTKDVKESNVVVESKDGKFSITNATLCPTENNNVRVHSGTTNFENVEVQGTVDSVTEVVHGFFVSKGTTTAKNLTITDAKVAAIRVNNDAEVTMDGVEIKNPGQLGLQINAGTTVITGLTTSGVPGNNIQLYGEADVTVKESTLGKNADNSIKAEDNAVLKLEDVVIEGHTEKAADNVHGIYAVEESVVTAEKLTVKNVHGAAVRTVGTPEVTLDEVEIKDAIGYGFRLGGGKVVVTNLTTEGVVGNNFAIEDASCDVTVKEAVLCATEGNNVRINNGTTYFENVEINGHVDGVTEVVHGLFVSKGTTTAKNLVIKDVKASAIRVNGGKVIAEEVIISNAGDCGINANAGTTTVTNLTTDNVKNYGVYMYGSAKVELQNAEMNTEGNSKYAIYAAESDCKLEGENITIANVQRGIGGTAGKIVLTNLTCTAANNENVLAEGVSIELNDATISLATANNMKIDKGSNVVLNDVTILGTSGDTGRHGIYIPNGTVTANNLTIQDTAGSAIRTNNPAATLKATKVTFKNLGTHGLQVNGGTIEITDLTTEGITAGHVVYNYGATNITLTNAQLSATGSGKYGIYSENASGVITGTNVSITDAPYGIGGKSGAITLTDSTINATLQNVLAEGIALTLNNTVIGAAPENNIKISAGSLDMNDVTILGNNGTKANVHAIYVPGGTVTANNLTIQDTIGAALRIAGGTTTVTNLVANNIGTNVLQQSGGNATLSQSVANNVNVTSGTLTLENVTVEGLVYNKGTLKVSGVVNADIYNDAAVTVNATSSLAGSTIVIDWPLDKLPAGNVGIQFASEADAQASASGITLGEITEKQYAPYFDGDQMLIMDKNYAFYKVKNYEEFTVALAHMDANEVTSATITLEGDIVIPSTVTIKEGKNVTIVDDGTARTILRDTTFDTNARGVLFDVSNNASLTFKSTGTDESPKLTVDGNKENIVAKNGNWAIVVGLGANTKVSVNAGVQFIDNSSTGAGCVIRMEAGTLTIDGGQFKNNTTTSSGGALTIMVGVTATIKNATFSGNKASYGGAIYLPVTETEKEAQLTVENCKFIGNTVTANGGAISTDNLKVGGNVFKNCTFTDNTAAGEGGAINAPTGVDLILEDCTFTGNTSTKETTTGVPTAWGNDIRLGGATNTTSISGEMVVEIFNRNASKITVKGTLEEGSDVMVDWCVTDAAWRVPSDKVGIVFDNDEAMNASQKYISLGGMMSPTYSLAYTNAQGILVAPIEVDTLAELNDALTTISGSGKPGVIRLVGNINVNSTITIPANTNVTIEDDGTTRTLLRTYTPSSSRSSMIQINVGATFTLRSTGTANESKLILDGNNITAKGNAPMIYPVDNANATVNILEGVTFQNNHSTGAGGVIRVQPNGGTINIDGATFKNNKDSNTGAVIYLVAGTTANIKNSTFTGNFATGAGAVISTINGSVLLVENCTFTKNTTNNNGAVLTNNNTTAGNAIFRGCTFTENGALGTSSEGGVINMPSNTYLELADCVFSGNYTNNTSTKNKTWGNDIRLGNAACQLHISGKMVMEYFSRNKSVLYVDGELTEGSNVVLNWSIDPLGDVEFGRIPTTGVQFASEDIANASAKYISLGINMDDYNLAFSGTAGNLAKKEN